jgi:cytochrome c-type biogenesis protein CcmF
MAESGSFALVVACCLSGLAVLTDLAGMRRRSLRDLARRATAGTAVCVAIASALLWLALVRCDFGIEYVAAHTSLRLPLVYKISAFWAGAAGSLLFWLLLQSAFVTYAFCRSGHDEGPFNSAARASANFVTLFFVIILLADKNPFARAAAIPQDGSGLNPLLQHPAMALHPPTLFAGYAAFAVAFAWALAVLAPGGDSVPRRPVLTARRWVLFAWLFLTVGIGLGAWWAYEELGWGGYWAWDPVENSSLLPWLAATALVHCFRFYAPGTAVAVWTKVLCILTYSLCIFGTFLTRYGLVSSVHAFPEPGLGILFLVLLVLMWAAAAVFFHGSSRREGPVANGPTPRWQRFVVLNNWLMILLAVVIFAGTMFPFFSKLVSSKAVTLKPEYFTKITAAPGLAVLLLMGVCPALIRKNRYANRRVAGGISAGAAAALLWLVTGSLSPGCFILCGFAFFNMAVDLKAGAGTRRYGAVMVHLGVVLVFLGIAGSGGYEIEAGAVLRPSEKVSVGDFDVTYENLRADHRPNFVSVTADVSVRRGGRTIANLTPAQGFHPGQRRTSEVDIHRTLLYDLYVALVDLEVHTGAVSLQVFLKPLINWIWIGISLSVLGAVLVFAALARHKFMLHSKLSLL